MSKIKIDHAEVESLAKTYDNSEEGIEEILTNLKNTQSALQEVWEGQAWTSFDETYQSFVPKVKEFGEFLGSVGDQLRENARIMRETDEQLQQANKLK